MNGAYCAWPADSAGASRDHSAATAGADRSPHAVRVWVATPIGVAVDPLGRLLIADFGANNVRRVTPSGVISTVAGTGTPGSTGDGGPASAAQLNGPYGIDVAPSGQIVLSELFGHRIRTIAPRGTITTLAGTTTGPGPIQVPPRAATSSPLSFPAGVAVDPSGNVLLTDLGNSRVAFVRGGAADIQVVP